MAAAATCPDTSHLNSRGHQTLLAVIRTLGWHASWSTMRTRPTRAAAAGLAGRSQRTITRWWKWLEQRGYLQVVEPGTLARYRPAVLHAGDPPLAREFVLTIPGPAGDSFVTPTWRSLGNSNPRARTRTREGGKTTSWDNPALEVTNHSLPARRVNRASLAQLLGPLTRAGFTTGDILYTLDHAPAGGAYWHTSAIRYPYAWIRSRLAAWAGHPPRSAQLADAAAAHHAARARDRAAHQAREDAKVPTHMQAFFADMARRLMARRLKPAYDQGCEHAGSAAAGSPDLGRGTGRGGPGGDDSRRLARPGCAP